MRRLFFIPLVITAMMVLIVAVTTTGTGLRLAARIVLPMVPGQLSFSSLDGRLIGPVTVTELSWHSEAGTLDVAQIDLDWQPSRLTSNHLYIDSLSARGVRWSTAQGVADSGTGKFQVESLALEISAPDLSLNDLLIVNGPTTIALDTVRLGIHIDKDNYRLDRLDLRSPAVDVSGSARLAVAEPNATETELNWVIRLKDSDTPITATTSAHGDLLNLDVSVVAGGALSLSLSAIATELLGTPQIAGQLEIERLDPAIGGLDIKSGETNASLSFTITPEGYTVDGRVLAPGWWPTAVNISTDSALAGNVLSIRRLRLKTENAPATVNISGMMHTDLSELDLAIGWTGLAWPSGETASVSSPSGTAKLVGSKENYSLQLNGTTLEGMFPAASISLRGQGTSSQFEIDQFTASFADGSLQGSGLLDWAATPKARLLVTSRDLELGRWQKQLEGRIGFDATVVASLPTEGAQGSIELSKVNGQLRGYSLKGSGAIDFAPGIIGFRQLDLRAGQAHIKADGRLADQLNLNWSMDIPDIGLFVPGSSGLLRSQGRASGRRDQPGFVGDLVMKEIKVGSFTAVSVDGTFDVGVDAGSPVQISLNGSGIRAGSVSVGKASSKVSGSVRQHVIEFEVDGPTMKLATTLTGAVGQGAWRGEITELIASRDDIGAWSLPNASSLSLSPDRVTLGQSCLVQRESRLCFGGEFARTEPWQTEFELIALPVETFAPFLPAGLIYQGDISGDGHVASSAAGWTGNLQLLLSDGRVISREDGEDDVLIAYQNGTIDGHFDPAGLKARMKFDLRDAGVLNGDITVPAGAAQQLQGTVQARIENLSLLTTLVPEISRIDGRIDANLALGGTIALPELTGQVGLQAKEMLLPDLGISLQDTVVTVNTQGTELRFDGTAHSGSGSASLTGELNWDAGRPQGQLALNGEQFRAIELPEIALDMSPALTLTIDGRDIKYGGSVAVPTARITPIDFSAGISATTDQQIIGQSVDSVTQRKWQISGSVQVSAGDAVEIDGYGLKGRLTGTVLIVDAPNQPTTARGALEVIDGRYSAYRQELIIETGRLEFTGGQIDDPGLNLRAARTTGDVTAGVQVRGTLRAPVLTLYSVPALSDTQAMSYLITGRSLEDLNEIDQTEVSDAATRLALRGGSLLASSLGRGLGLDSVEFEDSGAIASTSLIIGKHLSPRLFVSYGIGLFESVNTLRLRYRINSRLTLETQSGASTSADLLYSVERGR